MVAVAEMNIKGTLDTTEIDNGLRRVDQGMGKVKGQTKSTFSSMGLLSNTVSQLAKGLLTVGTVGVSALTALASKAPAVAPALAKMQIGIMKISHSMGRVMAPIFESVANDLIPAMGSALDRFSPQIGSFVGSVSEGIGKFSGALKDMDLSRLIPFSASALAGAAAGFALGGWPGAFIGLSLGAAIGTALIPNVTDESKEKYGAFAETATANQQQKTFFEEGRGVNEFGKGQVLAAKTGINAVIDTIEWLIKAASAKKRSYASPNSVS